MIKTFFFFDPLVMVIKGKLWDFWFRGFGYFFRSVFWFSQFWFSLQFVDFLFFSIWFSVFTKNINWFSDLISNVVFGFSHLTFLGSGFSSI